MTNLVGLSKLRIALLSSLLLIATVAATDEQCTKLTYDDEVEASLGQPGDLEDIDSSEDPVVSLYDDTLSITWSRGHEAVSLEIGLPARDESSIHRVLDVAGELCDGATCGHVEGAILLLEASETCSTSACDDGFHAVLRAYLEDGRLLVVEVSRKLDTEPTSCNSCCGSGGLLFI